MANGWRFIAQRVDGQGGLGGFLDFNVPIEVDSIEDVLSGHNGMSGTISPEFKRLKGDDGEPIIAEGKTAIWAEDPDGNIIGGGLVTHVDLDGPTLSVECSDLTFKSVETPYTESNFWAGVDPMDLFRHIWQHLQSQYGGNFGITVDNTISPIRLGGNLIQREDFDTEPDPTMGADDTANLYPFEAAPNPFASNKDWREKAVKVMKARNWNEKNVDDALRKWLNKDSAKADGSWKPLSERERNIRDKAVQLIGWPPSPPDGEGPLTNHVNVRPQLQQPAVDESSGETRIIYETEYYRLSWYETLDLAQAIDDLAASTPFDWHMTHFWRDDEIRHHIRLGYPKLGRRLDEMRFVIGENIHTIPRATRDGTRNANEIMVLGAGEGSAMVRGLAFRREPGVPRSAKVISAPWITSTDMANSHAASMLAAYSRAQDVEEVVLTDHINAPAAAVSIGDEFLLEGDIGWVDLETNVRVISRAISPLSGQVTLGIIRVDRII